MATPPSIKDMVQSMIDWNVNEIRKDFPCLHQVVNGKPLAYLDNAATTQKPFQVIDAITQFYQFNNANVHRGSHALSALATEHYEKARQKVKHFINAESASEIVFVKGTTEAINLVAQSYGRSQFKAGDEVILSEMEHHANIVPWQLLSEQMGIHLRIIPLLDNGDLDLRAFEKMFTKKTKLVTVVHTSNVLGTINPIKHMIDIAHAHKVPVLVDGAQAVAHQSVDVQALDCDFFTFSAHKMYGPTGIGVLYGKAALLEDMPPYQGGGDMIQTVSFKQSIFREPPLRFEAGTPNIAGVIGLGAAIDYLEQLGMENIEAYEEELQQYADQALGDVEGLTILGQDATHRVPVYSFVLEGVHAHDLAVLIDQSGVAIRDGHHCAMPVMQHFGVSSTARASLAMYNGFSEVDRLVEALVAARNMFE